MFQHIFVLFMCVFRGQFSFETASWNMSSVGWELPLSLFVLLVCVCRVCLFVYSEHSVRREKDTSHFRAILNGKMISPFLSLLRPL